METGERSDILCMPCGQQIFGIEFGFVAEICTDMHISFVPCLPAGFLGVCNYKGTIIPVIDMDPSGADAIGALAIPVIRYGKYMFGILCRQEPFILTAGGAPPVELPEDARSSGVWRFKYIYEHEDRMCQVIDVKGTVEAMLSKQ